MTRWPWVSYSSRWTSWASLAHKSFVSFYAFYVSPWRSGGTRLTWSQKEPVSIASQGTWQVPSVIVLKKVQTLHLTITPNILSLWECDGIVVKVGWDNASEAPSTRQELFLPDEALLEQGLCLPPYLTHGGSSINIGKWMHLSFRLIS